MNPAPKEANYEQHGDDNEGHGDPKDDGEDVDRAPDCFS